MAIGVVSESEFEIEVHKSSITAQVQNQTPKGRGEGNVEVPDALRKIIGETSEIEGRQEALKLASDFGISPSSVSAYSNGATSTTSYNSPNKELNNYIKQRKERVSKRANKVLIASLNKLTPEKLDEAKPIELSTIARNMAAIVKDMEPTPEKSVNPDNPGGVNFVLYAPTFIKEDHFDVIHLNE